MGIHPHPPDHCDPNGNLEEDQRPTILTDDRDSQYAECCDEKWHNSHQESFDIIPHILLMAMMPNKIYMIM